MTDKNKLIDRSMPGMMTRNARFAEVEHAENVGATLRRIFSYFARERSMVLAMIAVVVFGTVCGVYAPSLQSRSIDIIAGSLTGNLMVSLALMLGAYLIYSACQLLQGLLSARLSQRLVRRMREELFGKIVDMPIRYLDTHSHGDVMSRMTNDIENISTTVSQSLPSLCSGVLTILGTVTIMLCYCWQLALLSFATVILTMVATKFLSKKVRHFSRKRQQLLGQLNGTVEEMISGYRTVVAYNHQDITTQSFCETSDSLTKAGIRTDVFSGVMGPVMNCIGNVGFVIIAAFGGYFAVHGLISVGVISAFIVYAKQFSRPINEIAQIYGQLQTAIAGAERVFTVLDEQSEDMEGEPLNDSGDAAVRFENVNFSYEPGHPVIRDFTLTVPNGKKVALVGSTGSGKTTVVNLLMRFYEVNGGEIHVDGINAKDISRAELRRHFGMVLQDSWLFEGTIRDNLKYGTEREVSDEEMIAACSSVCADAFIRTMPGGYDMMLTKGASNISQGQRQLLTIARAIIANPEIMILDEATSNVDAHTEQIIQEAMATLMKGRTSFVIAHRLSTIRDANVILYMENGDIKEVGNHDTLMGKNGKYATLYNSQFA